MASGRWREPYDLTPMFSCVACRHEFILKPSSPRKHKEHCRAIPYYIHTGKHVTPNLYKVLPEIVAKYPHGGFKPDSYKRY